jgi:glycosyltransferase involved in cell wall biosynthesis
VYRLKRRLVVITEIIAPYRIPVFNALSARPEIDLLVLFLSETDPSLRQWHVYKQEIGFRYEVLPSLRRRVGEYNLLLNRGVAPALRRARPDVVLCGGYSYLASWQAASWAKRESVPFLLWMESTAVDRRGGHMAVEALKRKFLRWCTGFVVPGRSSREYLRQFGIADSVIFTAPNAVDSGAFRRLAEDARRKSGEMRQRLGLPERYFLNVGRLVEPKGVFDLLAAYAKLDWQLRSEVGLVFVGDGAARKQLMAKAQRISPGRIEFRGFLQRDELPAFYAFAEALVFPTHSDTWGFVVSEAMACGLPVVTSDVAGCVADLVKDQGTGLTVPPRDPSALASAMRILAKDAGLRSQMAERAIYRIRAYSPEVCAAAIVQAAVNAGVAR